VSCDSNDTLLPVRKLDGQKKRLGTTHIIVGTTVAKDGDASAAKLEDEKGQGMECHGMERKGDFVAFFSPAAFINSTV